jgi:hypothetical protein
VQHKEALRNTQGIWVVKCLGHHSLRGRRGKIKVNVMPIGSEGDDPI